MLGLNLPHYFRSVDFKIFRECLEGEIQGTDGAPKRDLVASDGCINGDLRLELSVLLSAAKGSWRLSYHFQLHAVKLERVDILESRIRDLENASEIREQSALNNSGIQGGLVCLMLRTRAGFSTGELLRWECVGTSVGKEAFKLAEDGQIRFLRAGLYQFSLNVRHLNSNPQVYPLELRCNDVVCQFAGGYCSKGKELMTSQTLIMPMTKDECFAVKNTGTGKTVAGSTLSILLLQ